VDTSPRHVDPAGHPAWEGAPTGQVIHVGSWWVRFFANLLDSIIVVAAIGALVGIGYALDQPASWAIVVIAAIAVFVLYNPLLLALNQGQTVGKKALSVKVINNDGSPTGFGRAFVREVCLKILPSVVSPFNLVDYLWAAFREDRRSLHDLGAGTVVIEDSGAGKARHPSVEDAVEWDCTLCGSRASGPSCRACGGARA
jgi:uncharacterized RDD family membrane protein YckC